MRKGLLVIEIETVVRLGSGDEEGLDALLNELLDDAEDPVDLDGVFDRFDAGNYSLDERGAIIVIALAIYERRHGLVAKVNNELILRLAANLLAEAMSMEEPCCGNPACHRRAMYLAIQRYNKDYGVPSWVAEAKDLFEFLRKENDEDLHY